MKNKFNSLPKNALQKGQQRKWSFYVNYIIPCVDSKTGAFCTAHINMLFVQKDRKSKWDRVHAAK